MSSLPNPTPQPQPQPKIIYVQVPTSHAQLVRMQQHIQQLLQLTEEEENVDLLPRYQDTDEGAPPAYTNKSMFDQINIH